MTNKVNITKKQLTEFIDELTKLTKKYNLAIGGCGCCGSPYVYGIKETRGSFIEDLDYDEQLDCYTFEKDADFNSLI